MNELVPSEFYLSQNYPNPFKEKTVIKYCVAYRTRVQLTIYNTAGEEIEKLVDEEQKAGAYKVEFGLIRQSGRRSLSGLKNTAGQTVHSLPGNQIEEDSPKLADFNNLSVWLKSGEYLYRLKAGDFTCEKKMIVKR
jgi:hypothetical protein